MKPVEPLKPARIPAGYLAVGSIDESAAEPSACSPTLVPFADGQTDKVSMEPVSACDAHSLALLFSPVFKSIRQMVPGQEQDDALRAAIGLEVEARRGALTDGDKVRQLLNTLNTNCPTALQAVKDLFQKPIPGVSTIFQDAALEICQDG